MAFERRVAYCAVPRAGGVFAHYRTLRQALAPLGWDACAVSVGRRLAIDLWDEAFADEGCLKVAQDTYSVEDAAREFVEWCVDEEIEVVLLTSLDASAIQWASLPHMPSRVKAVSRAYNSTPFSYRTATIHPARLSAVVATSQRQYDDLRRLLRVDSERISLIPHAVHADFLSAEAPRRGEQPHLTLGFVGRIKDSEKGVFRLPRLMSLLDREQVPYVLDIVGDGADRRRLLKMLESRGLSARSRYHGEQPRRAIPGFMGRLDVFIMLSYFEGFPNALVEAMACGAVPVVFRVAGVTDWIVEHGRTGLVVQMGDTTAAAQAVAQLSADRDMLRSMSAAAREAVRARFSPERMGEGYGKLFSRVVREEQGALPKPWDDFRAVELGRPSWRRLVPESVKRLVRKYIYR